MRVTEFSGLVARVVGGTDREGGGEGPVVVLLHGFGAPGDDLVSLARVLGAPTGTRFVFPEAPLDLGVEYANGRAWWPIDMAMRMRLQALGVARDVSEVPEGLVNAREKVQSLLRDVTATLRAPPGKVVLGGFSQGAMLSLDVALHSGGALAGLLLLSGTHIAATEWAARYDERRGLPVFMSHGDADPLLAFGIAERLRDTLRAHDIPVEWVAFHGGHAIPMDIIQKASAFLRRVLG